MGGVEVSVMRWSSTLDNVSPCTRPSCVRNSLVCIKADLENLCFYVAAVLESEASTEKKNRQNDLLYMIQKDERCQR